MALSQIGSLLSYLPDFPKKKSPTTAVISQQSSVDISSVIRLAGWSGAIGVAVGAYGAHAIRDDDKVDIGRRKAFETGSRYHLIHTLALLASPNSRYPRLTRLLFLFGILMYCGPYYLYSITSIDWTRRFTKTGGVLFFLGWLTFAL